MRTDLSEVNLIVSYENSYVANESSGEDVVIKHTGGSGGCSSTPSCH